MDTHQKGPPIPKKLKNYTRMYIYTHVVSIFKNKWKLPNLKHDPQGYKCPNKPEEYTPNQIYGSYYIETIDTLDWGTWDP